MVKQGKRKSERDIAITSKPETMRTLWDISQSLYQYLTIDDLILHIIKRMKEAMGVAAVSVMLHDEAKDEFVFCWAENDPVGMVPILKAIRFPVAEGIAGDVFKTGKAEMILDIPKDPRHYKEVDKSTGFKTNSMIAAPLKKKNKTIGVIEALNKRRGSFNEEDFTFFTTLVPIIAMALDNARMYAQLQDAYEDLKFIDKAKDDLIKNAHEENIRLRLEAKTRYRFDKIIGNSKQMFEVFSLCERVIDSDITVLVEGETGTGKELVASCIHFNSERKKKPFVTQNCGGVPDTLLGSELFGHKRGAFTGAYSDKKGLFEVANGGTVFLDEVAEMSPAMQTSLLRVLQEGEIKPLGADFGKKVDVRVISATNRNLETDTRKGRFREDLFYRLNVFPIKLPPLRERIGDISLLADYFVAKYNKKTGKSIKGLSREASQCLTAYTFPGNVRELENEIERAIAMAEDGKRIEISHISDKIRAKHEAAFPRPKLKGTLKEMVETLEKSVLTQLLEKHGGNKTKIAEELGLSRYGLTKKMQRYGM
jgi:Nif-specific regulatory protein